jgi:hypothetical protein
MMLGWTWTRAFPAPGQFSFLFAANGQTFESLQPHVRRIEVEGVPIATLDIDGLLKTKTDDREKDLIDKSVLTKLKNAMK